MNARETAPPPGVSVHLIEDKGLFPNNNHLPLVVYQGVFQSEGAVDPSRIGRRFSENLWEGSWRNGIYPYHHYHSTAHEVLGIYSGSVRVQFGGEDGITLVARAGDVLILPAGLAHKNIWCSHDFRVVGAYPAGTTWDMNYGKDGERPKADENIARVPLPADDPAYGQEGILLKLWKI